MRKDFVQWVLFLCCLRQIFGMTGLDVGGIAR